jgi:hypothetical protein
MNEYLVEVTPGRELVYRTPLALRAAMRSGEITAESRIYHRAASRWVSITEHPEYRKFLAERRPPDWLEPVPFERVARAPQQVEVPSRLRALKALLERAGVKVRARLARRNPPAKAPAGGRRATPPPNEEVSASPRDTRRWTFLP